MRAAHRAIRILAQLELAEAQSNRVDKQQAPDKRFAFAEDELDCLGGLDDAQQAGKNAENATLRATGKQSRRGRFGIEAAVAGTIFCGEHAGLALKSEARSVDVRLAQKHACVVDQIAGGK